MKGATFQNGRESYDFRLFCLIHFSRMHWVRSSLLTLSTVYTRIDYYTVGTTNETGDNSTTYVLTCVSDRHIPYRRVASWRVHTGGCRLYLHLETSKWRRTCTNTKTITRVTRTVAHSKHKLPWCKGLWVKPVEVQNRSISKFFLQTLFLIHTTQRLTLNFLSRRTSVAAIFEPLNGSPDQSTGSLLARKAQQCTS